MQQRWTSFLLPVLIVFAGLAIYVFTVGSSAIVSIRNLSNTSIGNVTVRTHSEEKTIGEIGKGEKVRVRLKRTPIFDSVTASFKTADGQQTLAIGSRNFSPIEFDIVSNRQIVSAEIKEYRLP